jgi:hypothetical protein
MVERRDALGDARRMIHLGGDVGDRGTDVHPLGARGDEGEEDLGGRLMGVVLEEMVLRRPDVLEARGVHRLGDLDLPHEAVVLVVPGRYVHLREDPKFHGASLFRF